jgi:hypothetical protein
MTRVLQSSAPHAPPRVSADGPRPLRSNSISRSQARVEGRRGESTERSGFSGSRLIDVNRSLTREATAKCFARTVFLEVESQPPSPSTSSRVANPAGPGCPRPGLTGSLLRDTGLGPNLHRRRLRGRRSRRPPSSGAPPGRITLDHHVGRGSPLDRIARDHHVRRGPPLGRITLDHHVAGGFHVRRGPPTTTSVEAGSQWVGFSTRSTSPLSRQAPCHHTPVCQQPSLGQ